MNNRIKIIAEIGINYAFGDNQSMFLDNAKKLIDVANIAGCDYVKFQKRNPEVCVPEDQKLKPKRVPWRKEETTYFQYKLDVEFGKDEYDEIDSYCKEKGMRWFASVWDKDSVDFMSQYRFENRCIMKIPSPKITDIELISYVKQTADFRLMSTGMSTEDEVEAAVLALNPQVIFHTNSTYPSPINELHLDYIRWLKDKYGNNIAYGYSAHEFGLITTVASALIGATWIERHITLDRTFWGSDQLASVEPQGLIKLVKCFRDIESARGGYGPRKIFNSELEKMKTLRK